MQHTISLTNDINEVPKMSEWIECLAEEVGLAMDKTFQLNLAMEEAVVNVMNYAYPNQLGMPILIEADIEPSRLSFVIDDTGIPYDPTQNEDPDLTLSAEERPIGGLGVMLVRQLMQEVSYEYRDGHNRLTLVMIPEQANFVE